MIDLAPGHLAEVRRILAEHVPGVEVRVFGSRVGGKAKKYSDLDLLFMIEQSLPGLTRARLEEAFSESDLPFRVDMVEWASLSPEFREIVLRGCETIQQGGVWGGC